MKTVEKPEKSHAFPNQLRLDLLPLNFLDLSLLKIAAVRHFIPEHECLIKDDDSLNKYVNEVISNEFEGSLEKTVKMSAVTGGNSTAFHHEAGTAIECLSVRSLFCQRFS